MLGSRDALREAHRARPRPISFTPSPPPPRPRDMPHDLSPETALANAKTACGRLAAFVAATNFLFALATMGSRRRRNTRRIGDGVVDLGAAWTVATMTFCALARSPAPFVLDDELLLKLAPSQPLHLLLVTLPTQARSIDWSPYDRVGVVNADP